MVSCEICQINVDVFQLVIFDYLFMHEIQFLIKI